MQHDFKVGSEYNVRLKSGNVVKAVYVKQTAQLGDTVSHHVLRSVKPWNGGDTFLIGVVGHQPQSEWECNFVNEVRS